MTWTLSTLQAFVQRIHFEGYGFRVLEKGDGFLLQGEYTEDDVETRNPELQRTRKWYISPHMTQTEVVDTCFALCERSMRHRCREHFTFDGLRIFSPHIPLHARVAFAGLPGDRRPDDHS
jgi:hypothetical protein